MGQESSQSLLECLWIEVSHEASFFSFYYGERRCLFPEVFILLFRDVSFLLREVLHRPASWWGSSIPAKYKRSNILRVVKAFIYFFFFKNSLSGLLAWFWSRGWREFLALARVSKRRGDKGKARPSGRRGSDQGGRLRGLLTAPSVC